MVSKILAFFYSSLDIFYILSCDCFDGFTVVLYR
jgi:hypothetical protein